MRRLRITSRQVLTACSIVVVCGISYLGWHLLQPKPLATIPSDISQELLFTPYVPSWLPEGYVVDTSSFTYKDGALLFAAYKGGSQATVLTISEQSTPKSFDIDSFYKSAMKSPSRLRGTAYSTVFGASATTASGTVAGATTDDGTWILISSSLNLKKDDLKRMVTGLTPQQ